MNPYDHILKDIAPGTNEELLERISKKLLDLPDKPEKELSECMKALKKWSKAFGKVGKKERKKEIQAWAESLESILGG